MSDTVDSRKKQLEEFQKAYDSIHVPSVNRYMHKTGSWVLFAGLYVVIVLLVVTFILSLMPSEGLNIYESVFGPEAAYYIVLIVDWFKTFSMLLCALGIWRIISLRSRLLNYGNTMADLSKLLKQVIDQIGSELEPARKSVSSATEIDRTNLK